MERVLCFGHVIVVSGITWGLTIGETIVMLIQGIILPLKATWYSAIKEMPRHNSVYS